MTTIAYAAGILCADSASSTAGGTLCGRVRKTGRALDGSIAAFTGGTIACSVMLAWFEGDRSGPKPSMGNEIGGLVVNPDGVVFIMDGDGDVARVDAPYHAFGSGFEIALGALAANASAERAVEIACELRGCSAGPVQVERL